MVCFIDGKPAKKQYRHFKIKSVKGPDDFASMKEVVLRRYTRALKEKSELPQLIVIDGGKGQLSSAVESLKTLGLYHEIQVVGIAKKLEEIFYPGDRYPLHINKKSETLRVLQHIRDEAHRFAITFHRNQRSKSALTSGIDTLEGIGPKSRDKLFIEFGSLSKIKQASVTEIAQVVGIARAQKIKAQLK